MKNALHSPNLISAAALAVFVAGCAPESAPAEKHFVLPEKTACPEAGVSRETFDFGWKFAKFGRHDDCLAKNEPGREVFPGTATSQEAHNPAGNAFDGNENTRWCAANASPAALEIDFGREIAAATTEVLWEKNAVYRHKIFVSADGKNWTLAADNSAKTAPAKKDAARLDKKFRFAKIAVEPSAGAWASIFEWRFFDAAGTPILPRSRREGEPPYAVAFDDAKWRALDLPHD